MNKKKIIKILKKRLYSPIIPFTEHKQVEQMKSN